MHQKLLSRADGSLELAADFPLFSIVRRGETEWLPNYPIFSLILARNSSSLSSFRLSEQVRKFLPEKKFEHID